MRAPDANEILLEVEGVSLAFGGVKALTDVSFDIRKREIRAIIGPNGAGKTSMLNVINGFYHPDHGAITFKGHTRARMRPFEASRGGIRAHFSERRTVQGNERARQYYGWPHIEDAPGPSVADAALRPCTGGGDRASAPGRGDRRFSGD